MINRLMRNDATLQEVQVREFLEKQVVKKICAGFDRHAGYLTRDGYVYTPELNRHVQRGLGHKTLLSI